MLLNKRKENNHPAMDNIIHKGISDAAAGKPEEAATNEPAANTRV